MKENLKIRVNNEDERDEVQHIGLSLGLTHPTYGKSLTSYPFDWMVFYTNKYMIFGNDVADAKEITLPELRELAKPREYLDENFKLVVTNQPLDDYILVPDGADKYTHGRKYGLTISEYSFWIDDVQSESNESSTPNGSMYSDYVSSGLLHKTLWQRENKVETSKGRFLHQWAYEAFGRGEDVQIGGAHAFEYFDLNFQHSLSDFNNPAYRFRLKPQTIQIGSHTINKPISVKPEMGAEYFVVDLQDKKKYDTDEWTDHDVDNLFLERGLIHLTKDDAINHADALLELMK